MVYFTVYQQHNYLIYGITLRSVCLPMNRYIITEEDICTIRDYVLGAFYEGENKEKIYDLLESQFSVMRSHPYQSERDKVLNNKLASRYKALLVQCMDTIEDIRRKYTIAPKSCKSCSAYDLCEELRQAGEP